MSLRAELLWQPQWSFEGVIAEEIQNMCNLLWTPDKDRRLEHGLQVAGLVFLNNQVDLREAQRVLHGVRIDSHRDKVLAASGALPVSEGEQCQPEQCLSVLNDTHRRLVLIPVVWHIVSFTWGLQCVLGVYETS